MTYMRTLSHGIFQPQKFQKQTPSPSPSPSPTPLSPDSNNHDKCPIEAHSFVEPLIDSLDNELEESASPSIREQQQQVDAGGIVPITQKEVECMFQEELVIQDGDTITISFEPHLDGCNSIQGDGSGPTEFSDVHEQFRDLGHRKEDMLKRLREALGEGTGQKNLQDLYQTIPGLEAFLTNNRNEAMKEDLISQSSISAASSVQPTASTGSAHIQAPSTSPLRPSPVSIPVTTPLVNREDTPAGVSDTPIPGRDYNPADIVNEVKVRLHKREQINNKGKSFRSDEKGYHKAETFHDGAAQQIPSSRTDKDKAHAHISKAVKESKDKVSIIKQDSQTGVDKGHHIDQADRQKDEVKRVNLSRPKLNQSLREKEAFVKAYQQEKRSSFRTLPSFLPSTFPLHSFLHSFLVSSLCAGLEKEK